MHQQKISSTGKSLKHFREPFLTFFRIIFRPDTDIVKSYFMMTLSNSEEHEKAQSTQSEVLKVNNP